MSDVIETIAALATPSGRGGVGVIRVSGPKVLDILQAMIGTLPTPRTAHYSSFKDDEGVTLDLGITLFFPGPHSFTGEDVIEFQGHGGPVIMDSLLKCILRLGARLAQPGEFSLRAFLNGKIDLAQAEAIADLIDSSSEKAAQLAVRSLEGAFSKKIEQIVERLIHLRMFIEAAIDFSDEEIDFIDSDKINNELNTSIKEIEEVLKSAKQGCLMREGMTVVIAGKPNAGKSSLLNALSGRESAIVTHIPGTTRDLLREHILIDGMPLHIIDTAGLRESTDQIEQEGIRRAWLEIKKADRILFVVDEQDMEDAQIDQLWLEFNQSGISENSITIIKNKIDKTGMLSQIKCENNLCILSLSAKTGEGIDLLREHLKQIAGMQVIEEGSFIARRRHLDALNRARDCLVRGQDIFNQSSALELLADDLYQCQNILGEITGKFSSDDLLGRIFSSFCIGK